MSAGPNYELDKLDVSVVEPGFIVGVSRVGTVVGQESPIRLDVSDQLLSLTATVTRDVEDDVYLYSQVPTLAMTALYEDTPDKLRGKVIIVQYDGQDVLFRGQVIQATRSVAVDTSLPGYRKWSVTLTATPGDDRSVRYMITAPAAVEADVATAIVSRIPYVSAVDVDPSLDLSAAMIAAGHEASMTAQELLRRVSRIVGCYVETNPAATSRITIRPYSSGPTWELRDDRTPSFQAIQFVESLDAATSVTVTPMFKPDDADPDNDLSVTRTLPGAIRNDVSVSVDVPYTLDALQAVANELPIKKTLPEYVSSITLPFDAQLDTSAVPSRVVTWLDGRRREDAVIGVAHDITPQGWAITLTCGPIHLLTRESDT